MLSEPNEKFVEFGIGGLRNYCLGRCFKKRGNFHCLSLAYLNCIKKNLDADCKRAILENGGIQEIVNCLSRYAVLAKIFRI